MLIFGNNQLDENYNYNNNGIQTESDNDSTTSSNQLPSSEVNSIDIDEAYNEGFGNKVIKLLRN